jgi:aspartokinase/homoserine dehydrogenase 1
LYKVKPTVLVATTDRWVPTARLAMALADAGCKVEVVCPSGHPVAMTKAAPQSCGYRGLTPLKSFAEAIAAIKPDFIIPGDDLATRHLHELHRRERQNGKAGAAVRELIERSLGAPESFPVMYARTSFMKLAREQGIRVPETQVIAGIGDVTDGIHRMSFPIVLKADATSGGDGVRIVHTPEEAARAFRKLQAPPLLARAAKRAVMDQDKTLIWPSLFRRRAVVNAQRFVAGHEATSTLLCWQGTVLAALHFEVLNKRSSQGPATVVRLIENAEMTWAAEKIAGRLNLSGLHGLDFMLETETGNAYLIEINPRATQVGHLTLGAGRDLPAALYAVLSGEPVQEAARVTDKDTIALFPHEWKMDANSPFLRTGYHDVPWSEPELLRHCLFGPDTSGPRRLQAQPRRAVATLDNFSAGKAGNRPSSSLSGFMSEHRAEDRRGLSGRSLKKPLRVMKFGGTSVGDASCIEKVVEIIRHSAGDSDLVVVVSAMSGVTNKLIDAANQAEAGNEAEVTAIFAGLREQHERVIRRLIHSDAERDRIGGKMSESLAEGDRLCRGTGLLRELTPRVRDQISSLGERLSAPIVAAVLAERGVASEVVDATELIVTDSCHGSADPRMDLTRERSQSRLGPLLQQGVVPVVTGFIGSTAEGALTTLGRGGSDYSATILGATLQADEVEIWTDVDGLMTADPRLVPDACTIPTISYQEAAELACFGAKVLHPKALRAVMQRDIPLFIRNTFAPNHAGTRITPAGLPSADGVKALTATKDVALITIGGPGMGGVTDVVGRAFATIAAVRADVLLISQSSSRNDICLVVSTAGALRTIEALRREFAHDLAAGAEHIRVDSSVAIVAVVGQNIRGSSDIAGRVFAALRERNVGIIAVAQGSSDCNISFVVAKEDMEQTVVAVHEEFRLGTLNAKVLPARNLSHPAAEWCYEPGRASAD